MKVLITLSLLLALAIPACADSFWDGAELTGAYAYSFTSHESLALGKLSVGVGSFDLLAHNWPVSAELLIAGNSLDNMSVGLGASIAISDNANGFTVGAGYMLQDNIGWMVTIGVLNLKL